MEEAIYFILTCSFLWVCTGSQASPIPITNVEVSPRPAPGVNGSTSDPAIITDGLILRPDVAGNPAGWARGLLGLNGTHNNLQFEFRDKNNDASVKAMRLDYFACPQWGAELQKLFINEIYEFPVPTGQDYTSSYCTGIVTRSYNFTDISAQGISSVTLTVISSGWLYLSEVALYSETYFYTQGDLAPSTHRSTSSTPVPVTNSISNPTTETTVVLPSATAEPPPADDSQVTDKDRAASAHNSTPLAAKVSPAPGSQCSSDSSTVTITVTMVIVLTISMAATAANVAIWLYCRSKISRLKNKEDDGDSFQLQGNICYSEARLCGGTDGENSQKPPDPWCESSRDREGLYESVKADYQDYI